MDSVTFVQIVAIVAVPSVTLGIVAIVFSARFKASASIKDGVVQVETAPNEKGKE